MILIDRDEYVDSIGIIPPSKLLDILNIPYAMTYAQSDKIKYDIVNFLSDPMFQSLKLFDPDYLNKLIVFHTHTNEDPSSSVCFIILCLCDKNDLIKMMNRLVDMKVFL